MSTFALPILDFRLVHAPLLGISALVNDAAVCKLGSSAGTLNEDLAGLQSALAEAPTEIPSPRRGPFDPQFFGLVTTRACNLNCGYCGFGAKTQAETMSWPLAVAGVDWMAAHAVDFGRETLDVHFFGGEPLVAFTTIEVAVHRARSVSVRNKLRPRLEVATNGFYSEERARFLGDHFQSVVLSFDGFEKTHNSHRPSFAGGGSFHLVRDTARILSESSADLCLRVCVAKDNVDQLPEIAEWFCEEFRPTTIDFETLQPTPETYQAGLQPADPYLFPERFIAARRIASQHGVEAAYSAAMIGQPRASYCPVGNDTLILQPDGRLTACYLPEHHWRSHKLDLEIGSLQPDGVLSIDPLAVERIRGLVEPAARCRRCFCRWTCTGGCRVNHAYPGCPDTYDDFCIQTRLIAACLLLQELEHGTLAADLFKNRPAMKSLGLQADDRLQLREEDNDYALSLRKHSMGD